MSNSLRSIIDSHIHVGRFRETYFPPKKIAAFLIRQGVKRCVVSATSAACGLHDEAERDLREMAEITELQTAPLLWVTQDLLRRYTNLTQPLKALPYCGIKIHPYGNPWTNSGLREVLRIADDCGLPILAHTGGNEMSDAGRWLRLLEGHRFPVVLAHGRPLDQTLRVLGSHDCAYTDTAFMPIPDVRKLIAAGHSRRIIFGSDTPIDRCYRSGPPGRRYRKRVESIVRAAASHEELLFEKNSLEVFF